jgi:hypothetical protein
METQVQKASSRVSSEIEKMLNSGSRKGIAIHSEQCLFWQSKKEKYGTTRGV